MYCYIYSVSFIKNKFLSLNNAKKNTILIIIYIQALSTELKGIKVCKAEGYLEKSGI